MRHLDCVTVCVGYADFLEYTLPQTKDIVDDLVVVTHHEDARTKELCRLHGIRYVATAIHHSDDAVFNKGLAINRGLDLLGKSDWILHLDADIYLPSHTRSTLNKLTANGAIRRDSIHGIDRVNCPNYAAWKEFVATWSGKKPSGTSYGCNGQWPPFPPMGRYNHPEAGWLPIGFFQLWHNDAHDHHFNKRYPVAGNEAIHSDVQHALQWDEGHRHLIPEIVAIHLDSCDSPIGANWRGRTTPEFGPHNPTPSRQGVKSYYDQAGKPTGLNPNRGKPQ